MERKVNIEFIGQTRIQITTPFRQRVFDLAKLTNHSDKFIDLVTLTILDKRTPFWALVYGDGTINSPYKVEVRLINNIGFWDIVGTVSIIENSKTFKVSFLDGWQNG